jgi:NUMOD4 motif
MKETWKNIPGFSNYEASNFGQIRRIDPMKILVPRTKKCKVKIRWNNQKVYYIAVGRLVLLAFRRPPKEKEECRHLDDQQWNNVLDNLKWGSRQENMNDAMRNGIYARVDHRAKGKKAGRTRRRRKTLLRALGII